MQICKLEGLRNPKHVFLRGINEIPPDHYDIPSTSRTPLPTIPTADMDNEHGSMSQVIPRRDPTKLNRQRELQRVIRARRENAI